VLVLSPGISPVLAVSAVVGVPLLFALGYLLGGRRGFELAVAAASIALGSVKGWTDARDLYDLPVWAAAVFGGAVLLTDLALRELGRRTARWPLWIVGGFAVVAGLWKLQDLFDPFDVILADAAIVAGLVLLLGRLRRLPLGGA
jgi:hypothetical protein